MSTQTARYFRDAGLLAQELPGFHVRPEQQQVAALVEETMRFPGQIALIEAGTGVGKTFAYLIPALERARPDRKIIISTHTLALQAQLAEKDVPFVRSLMKKEITVAVMKGRGNYLCLQDLETARADLWTVGDPQFSTLLNWAQTTQSGDQSELDFHFPAWGEVRANADTCKSQDCRFYDRCFYYKMRREANEAGILLVNHALFFSDLAMRQQGDQDKCLLPDYDFVVFDEAHHLEAAATAAFGIAFSSARLSALMEKIRRAARHLDLDLERLKAIEGMAHSLFSIFTQTQRAEFLVDEVLHHAGDLQNVRTQVAGIGAMLDATALELLKQDTGGIPALKDRVDGLRRQCVRAKEELTSLFLSQNENFIRWGSHQTNSRRGVATTLHWTPVSVAPLLNQALWRMPRSIGAALISATLSTDGGFDYIRRRLGIALNEPGVVAAVIGSPFNYPRQCLLYLPKHLPLPAEGAGYTHAVVSEIAQLIRASGGGAFLLFTSYRALQAAYEQLQQEELPYPLLRQGDMPNARLIQAFKEQPDAVLFGTQTFWEGVDLPGEALRLVVIDRLPFAVPDSPVHKARVESITDQGGDWFHDFALPQAQLKLKQGFGRLIRTVNDRGVVAILDTRLVHKGYGKQFLRFLPPARVVTVIEEVREFYAAEQLPEIESVRAEFPRV